MIAALLHGVALAAAMTGAIAGRAGPHPAPPPELPLELEGRFTYELSSEDGKGVPSVPLCRSARRTATLDIRLRRTELTPLLATYTAVAGEWRVTGACTGTLTWEIAEPPGTCTWTATGEESGTGRFPDAMSGVTIDVNRRAGTAALGFLLAGATSHLRWEYSCERPGDRAGASSTTAFVTDGFDVPLQGSGATLVVQLDGSRTWQNENVGGRYTATTTGTLRARSGK
jgi:hypothetical protein